MKSSDPRDIKGQLHDRTSKLHTCDWQDDRKEDGSHHCELWQVIWTQQCYSKTPWLGGWVPSSFHYITYWQSTWKECAHNSQRWCWACCSTCLNCSRSSPTCWSGTVDTPRCADKSWRANWRARCQYQGRNLVVSGSVLILVPWTNIWRGNTTFCQSWTKPPTSPSVDLKDSYLHCEFNKESGKLTTFVTP